MRLSIASVCFILLTLEGLAQAQEDDILGTYWTDTKEGKIEIFKQDQKFFGRIVWRKDARKDIENPDASLRGRSVIGLVFLTDFSFDGNEIWEGGEVYSIDNGGTYSGKLWLEDDGKTLKMRGFLGFSFIGRTATLTRAN